MMVQQQLAQASQQPQAQPRAIILLRIEEDVDDTYEAVGGILRGRDTAVAPCGFLFQRCGGGRRVIRRQRGAY